MQDSQCGFSGVHYRKVPLYKQDRNTHSACICLSPPHAPPTRTLPWNLITPLPSLSSRLPIPRPRSPHPSAYPHCIVSTIPTSPPQETLHHLPSSEVPLDQLTVRVKELEETLAHRERERAVLEERLKGSLEDQQQASQQYQGHIKRLREEMNQWVEWGCVCVLYCTVHT